MRSTAPCRPRPRGRAGGARRSTSCGPTPTCCPRSSFPRLADHPDLRRARLSFTDDKFLDQAAANWIGLQNYRDVLNDALFWEGIKRAFIFTLIFVPGMIFIPMAAAVCLDRVTSNKLSTVYRVILLIPAMIPAPLIFVLWLWMYNNYVGPINYVLVDVLGLFDLRTQPQWITDPRLLFFSIAAMEWWWGLGYHTMFFLAGWRRSHATSSMPRASTARANGACSGGSLSGGCCRSSWS